MEHMDPMDDTEIQEKVESLVGQGVKVVDCEKSTSFHTSEVLLVNGMPVPLTGEEGARVKKALMSGQVPPGDLLNIILIRAGILKAPVELETTMNVKTTTKTTELLTLRDKNGLLVDERMKEVEEDNEFQRESKEVWKAEDERNAEELRRMGKRVEKLNVNIPENSIIAKSISSHSVDKQEERENEHELRHDRGDGKGKGMCDSDRDRDSERGGRRKPKLGAETLRPWNKQSFEENGTSRSSPSLISPEDSDDPPPPPLPSSPSPCFFLKRHNQQDTTLHFNGNGIGNINQSENNHNLNLDHHQDNNNSLDAAHFSHSSPSSSSCSSHSPRQNFFSQMSMDPSQSQRQSESPSPSLNQSYSLGGIYPPFVPLSTKVLKKSNSVSCNNVDVESTSPILHPPLSSTLSQRSLPLHHRPKSPPPLPPSKPPRRSQSQSNVQLTYLDPGLGTLHCEVNGENVRVSYETFV